MEDSTPDNSAPVQEVNQKAGLNTKFIRTNSNQKREKTKYPELRGLWIGVYSDILGFTILMPYLPFLLEDFGGDTFLLGWLLSINALFGFIFGPIFGKLSDKYGRKPLLLIAQIGTFASFLMLAFSPNLIWIFASRILDGIFGGNYPLAKAIIGDVVKPKDRSDQMANIGVAHNLANLLGPAIAALLAPYKILGLGLSGALLSLISILATIFTIEESAPLVVGMKENTLNTDTQSELENNNNPGTFFKNNKEEISIWANRLLILLLIQWFFHALSFISYLSQFSVFSKMKFDLGRRELGLLLSIAGAFQIIIKFTVFMPVLRRTGEKTLSIIGLSLFVIAYALLGFVAEIWQLIFVMLIVSFAASSTRGVLTSIQTKVADKRILGKVMGYNTSLDSISQVIAPLLAGYVLKNWGVSFYGAIPMVLSIIALGLSATYKEIHLEHKPEYKNNQKVH